MMTGKGPMAADRGYLHCYYGDGKGKTTAALGLALRAWGAGWPVLFAQFLKRGEYGEVRGLRRLGVEVLQFGSGRFVRGRPGPQDIRLAREGWARIEEAAAAAPPGLLVLDELHLALSMGLLAREVVEPRIQGWLGEGVEVVTTGRNPPDWLLEQADLATEMRLHRHYYQRGVPARSGVEY